MSGIAHLCTGCSGCTCGDDCDAYCGPGCECPDYPDNEEDLAAPPHGDPFDAAVDGILADLRALLDKARAASPLSAADLPDIREALVAAIYDGPLDEPCDACAPGGMCPPHHERAKRCARWTEILHRIDGLS